MRPEDVKNIIRKSFTTELKTLGSFKQKYILMVNLKNSFKELPEFLIYKLISDECEKINYKKNKEKYIEEFLNRIFPIISGKTTEQ